MTERHCRYPRCENTFTGGPKNQKYCHDCGRHRWESAERHFKNIMAEGGEPLRELIALVYDDYRAAVPAVRQPGTRIEG